MPRGMKKHENYAIQGRLGVKCVGEAVLRHLVVSNEH